MRFDSKDEFKLASEQLLIHGNNTLTVQELFSLIPEGVENSWDSSWSDIAEGFKYRFILADGTSVTIKWHSEDPDAAQRYPGCNSGEQWTAQIRVGNRLLRYGVLDWVRRANNETHISLR